MDAIDLLWSLALFLCLGLWGVVLLQVLEQSRRRRRDYSPSTAEQRASTLLNEWLTREQHLQYQLLGHFEVRGSHSGKLYRIRHASQMNVDQLDERGDRVAVLCFLPGTYVPVSDVMLAQKIMLENDEPTALSVANRVEERRLIMRR